jgi:GntR family transcriptional repressor for pyruvate dehydrogenase complex
MEPAEAPPRRSEAIARAIEEAMLDGRIAPGDRLPSERDLMARFGAGRGTVREALFALRKMGLVQASPGERSAVTRPTPRGVVRELSGAVRQFLATEDGVRQFQEARHLLERALAREAARRATPAQLRTLFAACEAHRTARDAASAIDADVAFHETIARIGGNPVLSALHGASIGWLREQRSTSVRSRGAKPAAELAHRRIYDAIAAGDADAAERAMGTHLDEVAAHYWRAAGRVTHGKADRPGPGAATAARGRREVSRQAGAAAPRATRARITS